MGKKREVPSADLSLKLKSGPPRHATPIDFQAHDERIAVGRRLQDDRAFINPALSDEALILSVAQMPVLRWAIAAYVGHDRPTSRLTARAIRNLALEIDTTSTAGELAGHINNLWNQQYPSVEFELNSPLGSTPTIDATSIVQALPVGHFKIQIQENYDVLLGSTDEQPLMPPLSRFFVQWRHNRRPSPGEPAAHIAYVERFNAGEFGRDPLVAHAVHAIRQGLSTPIRFVAKVQLLADYDQARLTGPLSVGVAAFDYNDQLIINQARLIPLAENIAHDGFSDGWLEKMAPDLLAPISVMAYGELSASDLELASSGGGGLFELSPIRPLEPPLEL